jgi:hypothetical protein
MISIKVKGNTDKTETFLRRNKKICLANLDKYGEMGVSALSAATPIRTGLTAASWLYEIREERGVIKIIWKNTNIQNGNMVVALLVYGHATNYGTYVEGNDFVSPSLIPVLKKIADDAFLEVTE